ncbi:hypothetical protein RND81_13G012300 [Saponaria officinalis]|uniref:Histidine decarboxylase n=1 Tax=Saponaria officinalis TaxID=3572 RepID=A0AAW1H351_SAPOF
MVGTSMTQDMSKHTSQNVAKDKTIKQNGCQKKGIVSRNNVEFQCLDIIDSQFGNPITNFDKDEYITSNLANLKQSLQSTKLNLGFALSLDIDYSGLDPFIESNYSGHTRQFEVGVLDWFARLWEIDTDDYWGYVTSGGSEGNLHGILLGRELFPDGILYASKNSHFSIFKAARLYRMECVTVDTLVSGEIDCADFKAKLLQNKDKPAIVCVTLGTTVKGAIDDVDLVIQTLEECGFKEDRFYIHCDGAMYGLVLPLLKDATPKITFKKPIGSISVSGHKFLACTMPCGIQMTRLKHINVLSREVEYTGSPDATISCSRNGHTPVFLWYALNQKGYFGFKQDFEKCLRNAEYLKGLFKDAGFSVMLNSCSSTVVFERPRDERLVRRWQLSCQGDIAHVIVMPNDKKEKLDDFFRELVESWSSWFEDEGHKPVCVASDIGDDNCACAEHKNKTFIKK